MTEQRDILTIASEDEGQPGASGDLFPSDQSSHFERPAEPQPVTIVVPCYNEAPTLSYLENTLASFSDHGSGRYVFYYVFVDDGSQDRSRELLQSLFADRSDCKLVRHDKNRGIAAAVLTGINHADTELVCVIDCDCSYHPEHLRTMLPMMSDDVDLVTASPYHPSGSVKRVPAWRLVMSKIASMCYRRILHHKLATSTSCCRVYRKSKAMNIRLWHEGFLGITELIGRMDLEGAKIVECPASLEGRMFGRSKMRTVHTALGHIGLLARLIRLRWTLRYGNGGT